MDRVVLQLGRGHSSAGVGDHEAESSGKPVGGDFLNRHTVQNPDHALQAQIVANVGFKDDVLAFFHQRIGNSYAWKKAVDISFAEWYTIKEQENR